MASCSNCGGRHRVDRVDGKLVAEPCKPKESRVNPRGQPSGEVAKPTDHDRSRDSATPSKSRYRATPTHVDGIRFASKGEAALYSKAKADGWIVVPHIRFPLHVLHTEGTPATWFSPDLLCMAACPDNDSAGLHEVQAWEFKGPKFLESRDYALRAKAFRATYPSIPLRTFRMVRGQLQEDV